MKNTRYIQRIKFRTQYYLVLILMMGLFTSAPVYSQTEEASDEAEAQQDTTQAEAEETAEKKSLRMSFETYKINQELKLVTKARAKVEGRFQNVTGVEISFYKEDTSPENLLGKDTTNNQGEAYWIVSAAVPSDSAELRTYWLVIKDHPDFEDAEESATEQPSVMEMQLEEKDSIRMVNVYLGYPDESGQIVPLAEAECQLYIKRLFGLLPVGESSATDEEGRVVIEFPQDLSGYESGNLTVIVKVAEHEIVGNVEMHETITWGKPVIKDDFYTQRELWSARANSPIPLVVIVNAVLIGVWGVIGFIFLEIIKINRIGKTI